MAIHWEEAYYRLFDIIEAGGNREAPEYFSGPRFINTLKGISYNFPQNYTKYIQMRSNKKLPTSRKVYYQEILEGVPQQERVAAYKAIFRELGTFTSRELMELKKMFGEAGDELIRPVVPVDPMMSDNTYQQILKRLRDAITNLETKPDLYRLMGEEQIRDYITGILEPAFEHTTVTRESFNKAGRTDILVRHTSGNNLFVAECKIWAGKAGMLAAITQLMGYLTYRDSKAALLLFVDRDDIDTVLQRIAEYVSEHPQYKSRGAVTERNSSAHVFSLPGNPDGDIHIEIIVGHFPR
ncbi:hypothetical protein [Chitinophaga rhizosphaerae]|uniref:hypothetical protein n=1 Tax=Chitinophaga rhizosphaerae TaxID=1864947 RepID=UPI000F8104E4|nr:hypothetical protein [Chitinophaga rhizosphaerae]